MANRIALGTANFGMPYGRVSHYHVSLNDIEEIISLARKIDIDTIDTAEAYGNAETLLGEVGISNFKVISKIGRLENAQDLEKRAVAGLARLRIDQFEALLLHAPDQIFEDAQIQNVLSGLKSSGLTKSVGVSIYDPDELSSVLDVFQPDLVQLPLCALDARWDVLLHRLNQLGIRIHLRSIYLQGLLTTLSPPLWASPWGQILSDWRQWVADHGTTLAKAALVMALSHPVERVVIGLESVSQLSDTINLPHLPKFPNNLKSYDNDLLDPRKWPKS